MANEDYSSININEEYYYLKHLKVLTNSTIVASSSYTNDIEVLSSKIDDTLYTTILNTSNKQKTCNIRYNKKLLKIKFKIII